VAGARSLEERWHEVGRCRHDGRAGPEVLGVGEVRFVRRCWRGKCGGFVLLRKEVMLGGMTGETADNVGRLPWTHDPRWDMQEVV
jgi:hypothetical protein